jgi:predicted transposase YbfD/YdcC
MRMQQHPKQSLIEYLSIIPDPRVDRTREHELVDVLVIAVCTLLCAGESFYDMEDFGKAREDWFKTFLTLRSGIPSHDTFNRVFAAIDPEQFLESFLLWTQSVRQAIPEEIVALDGKALRRAVDKGEQPKYIVSAWAQSNGLVLGQMKVADKSNEITAIPQLLRRLELAGCIVTLDAMGCQKEIAREIIEADAQYVLALKGNHETAHQEISTFLDDAVMEQKKKRPKGAVIPPAVSRLRCYETAEKGHGRLETRRYYQSDYLDWFADKHKWEGLRSVGMVEATREIRGQKSVERRYYLSSLPLDAEKFGQAVRLHWSIENQLHWTLDVVFGEDQNRTRTGYALENLATLRRLALNLLKGEKSKKRGIKGKMLNASWDHAYLLKLLGVTPPV